MRLSSLILIEVGFAVAQSEPPTAWSDDPPSAWIEKAQPSAQPVREYWGGQWGWMEKGSDGVYRKVADGGAAAPRHFPVMPGTIQPTLVPRVAGASSWSPGFSQEGSIRTLAPRAVQSGGTNCSPAG